MSDVSEQDRIRALELENAGLKGALVGARVQRDRAEARVEALVAQRTDLRQAWAAYTEFLKAKYPAPPGEEWRFTCPHHQAIDALLKGG